MKCIKLFNFCLVAVSAVYFKTSDDNRLIDFDNVQNKQFLYFDNEVINLKCLDTNQQPVWNVWTALFVTNKRSTSEIDVKLRDNDDNNLMACNNPGDLGNMRTLAFGWIKAFVNLRTSCPAKTGYTLRSGNTIKMGIYGFDNERLVKENGNYVYYFTKNEIVKLYCRTNCSSVQDYYTMEWKVPDFSSKKVGADLKISFTDNFEDKTVSCILKSKISNSQSQSVITITFKMFGKNGQYPYLFVVTPTFNRRIIEVSSKEKIFPYFHRDTVLLTCNSDTYALFWNGTDIHDTAKHLYHTDDGSKMVCQNPNLWSDSKTLVFGLMKPYIRLESCDGKMGVYGFDNERLVEKIDSYEYYFKEDEYLKLFCRTNCPYKSEPIRWDRSGIGNAQDVNGDLTIESLSRGDDKKKIKCIHEATYPANKEERLVISLKLQVSDQVSTAPPVLSATRATNEDINKKCDVAPEVPNDAVLCEEEFRKNFYISGLQNTIVKHGKCNYTLEYTDTFTLDLTCGRYFRENRKNRSPLTWIVNGVTKSRQEIEGCGTTKVELWYKVTKDDDGAVVKCTSNYLQYDARTRRNLEKVEGFGFRLSYKETVPVTEDPDLEPAKTELERPTILTRNKRDKYNNNNNNIEEDIKTEDSQNDNIKNKEEITDVTFSLNLKSAGKNKTYTCDVNAKQVNTTVGNKIRLKVDRSQHIDFSWCHLKSDNKIDKTNLIHEKTFMAANETSLYAIKLLEGTWNCTFFSYKGMEFETWNPKYKIEKHSYLYSSCQFNLIVSDTPKLEIVNNTSSTTETNATDKAREERARKFTNTSAQPTQDKNKVNITKTTTIDVNKSKKKEDTEVVKINGNRGKYSATTTPKSTTTARKYKSTTKKPNNISKGNNYNKTKKGPQASTPKVKDKIQNNNNEAKNITNKVNTEAVFNSTANAVQITTSKIQTIESTAETINKNYSIYNLTNETNDVITARTLDSTVDESDTYNYHDNDNANGGLIDEPGPKKSPFLEFMSNKMLWIIIGVICCILIIISAIFVVKRNSTRHKKIPAEIDASDVTYENLNNEHNQFPPNLDQTYAIPSDFKAGTPMMRGESEYNVPYIKENSDQPKKKLDIYTTVLPKSQRKKPTEASYSTVLPKEKCNEILYAEIQATAPSGKVTSKIESNYAEILCPNSNSSGYDNVFNNSRYINAKDTDYVEAYSTLAEVSDKNEKKEKKKS